MIAAVPLILIDAALIAAILGFWPAAAVFGSLAFAVIIGVWLLTEAGVISPAFGK